MLILDSLQKLILHPNNQLERMDISIDLNLNHQKQLKQQKQLYLKQQNQAREQTNQKHPSQKQNQTLLIFLMVFFK